MSMFINVNYFKNIYCTIIISRNKKELDRSGNTSTTSKSERRWMTMTYYVKYNDVINRE